MRRHAGKLIASVLITAGVIYTVEKGGLRLVPDGSEFSRVRWWAVGLYVPLFLAMTWFRSVRWRFLLRSIVEVPKMRLFAVSCAGFLATLVLPFRIGELARPYMLRTRPSGTGQTGPLGSMTRGEVRPGEPVLTMTAATSSVVAERVIDGLFLSVMLAIVLIVVPTIQPLPDRVIGLPVSTAHVRMVGFVLVGVFSTALVVISVFYFARNFAVKATRAVIGKISTRLADRLATIAAHLADGLHVLQRGRDALAFIAETAAYWLCNALAMWVLAMGCGIVHADGSAITFPEACAVLGMLGCAIMIPGPPGLLGVFQAGVFAGMTMFFPRDVVIGPGAAYAFLLYSTTVLLTIVTGLWGVWHEGGARRLRGALDASRTI